MDSHDGIWCCPLWKIKPSTPGLPCMTNTWPSMCVWNSGLSVIKNKTQYTWTPKMEFGVVRYGK
jgi:hypothetical protein